MKTQKLQFSLTSLQNFPEKTKQKLIKTKNKKNKKTRPTVIIKANRKTLT